MLCNGRCRLTWRPFATSCDPGELLILDSLAQRYGGPPSMWAKMSAEDLAVSWAAWRRGKEQDAQRVKEAQQSGMMVAGAVILQR